MGAPYYCIKIKVVGDWVWGGSGVLQSRQSFVGLDGGAPHYGIEIKVGRQLGLMQDGRPILPH